MTKQRKNPKTILLKLIVCLWNLWNVCMYINYLDADLLSLTQFNGGTPFLVKDQCVLEFSINVYGKWFKCFI